MMAAAEIRQEPAAQHPDYFLVQQYLQGDGEIWDSLYLRAYPVAGRYLRRQKFLDYLCPSDAEDILSEAFRRCQLRAHRFQGRSSFSRWVCGYVRYIALDTVRKRIREDRKFSALKDLRLPVCTWETPEAALLRRERDHYLHLAYSLLPAHHQVLIGYLVLGSHTYWDARRVTRLRRREAMEEELACSLAIFREFYLKLYGR